MATHPFEKMFDKALRKSTDEENLVLRAAVGLAEKGYRGEEIRQVLNHFHDSLIQDADREMVKEALDAFEGGEA